ncbi:MAG TPA: EcsC family protein [Mobilitalea sp.]|nr:EcsC family protein [Mobilitalea sp.]
MKNILDQQLKRLEKQEQKLLNQPENSLMKSTITPAIDKIQTKIPPKLIDTLNMAFYKGFQFVFEKGSPIIEKTYSKERIAMDFDINDYAVDKSSSKRHMNRLDKQSVQSKLLNTSFSAVEGGVLGVLGIGLPDIPLFLSVVIKTMYEVALSYGFGYDSPEEKAYILLLICGAITKGERQKEYNSKIESLGAELDQNIVTQINLDVQMKEAAEVLSDALLTAKFIQGIPFVGVVGGIVNYNILNKISSYARMKYKKRYLKKKLSE